MSSFQYPSCTLVTACFDLHKYNPKCRTTEECLHLIDPLLQIPVYLVIYGSKTTIPAIRARRHKYDAITQYIEMEIEDLWTYQFLDQVKQNRAKYWPTRDERTCAESHIICCNKFDFVMETISINPFNTTHFGWIDAYLGTPLKEVHQTPKVQAYPKVTPQVHQHQHQTPLHQHQSQAHTSKGGEPSNTSKGGEPSNTPTVASLPKVTPITYGLRICENYTQTTIPRILRTIADEWKSSKFHIQILNACDKRFKEPQHKREYYNQYRWITCGGFFVTAPDAGIAILSRLKEIFVETTMAGYGHGEEMFYLEVLDEYKDQIRGTYGDYGQILDNFIYPTRNIEYVFHTIMANYERYGYHAEYAAAAAQLKESADKSWVIIDDDTYRTIEKYS
jgi:hypothetical protein